MARPTLAFLFFLAILPWPALGKDKQEPKGVPGLTWIRKVYLTGSKERAIKVGHRDLPDFTCLEPVDRREDADAIVVLSQTSHRLPPPDRTPSGIMSCRSTASGASCMDTGSGMETTVTCSRNGSFCDVSTGYNMGAAALDLAGAATRALEERARSVAVLVDKSSSNVLWQWDEGYDIYTDRTKGHGFYSGIWWGELNIAVGCGKATINPHKHGWKPGQWPEPTPKPAQEGVNIATQNAAPVQVSKNTSEQATQSLTNESIVKLVKSGLGDETIITMVNPQPGRYSLGVDDIIALKKAGVSEKVIAAMLDKAARGPTRVPAVGTEKTPEQY